MNDNAVLPRQLFLDRDFGNEYRLPVPLLPSSYEVKVRYNEPSENTTVQAVYYYYRFLNGKYVYNFAGVRVI